MTTANYNEMTGAELLAVYNSMVHEEAKQLHVWKHAKAKLIDRIYAMERARSVFEQVGPSEPHREVEDMPKKKAPKEAKPRKVSKSMRMLLILVDQGEAELKALVDQLATSEGSVRSYVSYFKTGKKGHPQINMSCEDGVIFLLDAEAADKFLGEYLKDHAL